MVFSMICILFIIYKWNKFKTKKLELEKYQIDINVDISNNIEQKLDEMIESCFQEYSLLNIFHKDDWYINEANEIKINKDINYLVAQRISPVMMKQLSLYYNIDSITDIIAKKVYFKVTNFVIEHNKIVNI